MKSAEGPRLGPAARQVETGDEGRGMSEAEEALVETKRRMGAAVRALRLENQLSQADLAKLMGSTQPRVAKLENRDPEVSLDLQMRAAFAASGEARREFQRLVE